MSDLERPTETVLHTRCRNLVWEPSPHDGDAVPGRYCMSRVGAVHSMDCPVYQGCSCCLFDPREEDEPPEVGGEERLDEIRELLTADFLRWSYWKRVDVLRAAEPPPVPGVSHFAEEPPEAVAAPAPAEAVPESDEIVRHELPPPPQDEALKEKYPGQRRSEDRRRSRMPATPVEGAVEEDEFTRGIFELPSLDPGPGPDPEAAAPPDEGPPDEGPPDEGPPDEGPPDEGPPVEGPPVEGPSVEAPAGEKPARSGRRSPRRRTRRRRGRKNGNGPSGRNQPT